VNILNDRSGRRLFNLLKEINSLFDKDIREHLAKWNITIPQVSVLSLLRENSEMKISELAFGMGLADSNITGIVDRLEQVGLVERIRSMKDRRIVKVRLTCKAHEMIRELESDIEKYFSKLIERFSKNELSDIITCMETLKEKLAH